MKFVRFVTDKISTISTAVITERGYEVIEGDIFSDWGFTGQVIEESKAKLLAPLAPHHILGIGKNFVTEGAAVPEAPELPIWFFKPTSAVIGPDASIMLPAPSYEAKFESELAVIIGKEGKNIKIEDVQDYIFGYTVANDLADSTYFHTEGHWTVGKSFDTFCPLGPHIETELQLDQVRIKSYLNGQQTQDSGLDLMITSVAQQVAYVSTFMTIHPGDVILTGTPAGAIMLHANDVIECEITGLGVLRNTVVNAG
jgi:2-keto-4-pentenoate hydratase/2-oxohepta-3-ene-1,7-dioic acid hydratase in catechol pathway